MNDVMKIAQDRRAALLEAIAGLEEQIETMREDIAGLDSFLSFGAELMDAKAPENTEESDDPFERRLSREIRDESDMEASPIAKIAEKDDDAEDENLRASEPVRPMMPLRDEREGIFGFEDNS